MDMYCGRSNEFMDDWPSPSLVLCVMANIGALYNFNLRTAKEYCQLTVLSMAHLGDEIYT